MAPEIDARTARPLRFAMVTTFYPPFNFGGDGLYVQRLVHALARRGHSVDVIHDADAYRVLGGGAHPEPIREPSGVTVHTMRSAVPWLSAFATHQLGRPVVHRARIQAILARDFDVVHFHNVSLVGGPGIFSYGRGVKLYTAHEQWLVCPTHTLWRHNREICTGRECLRCTIAYRRPPQLWRNSDLLARQARHVDAFIALSRFSADKHAEFGFTEPMTVMPSFLPDLPVPAGPPQNDSAPGRDGRPYFLFVGRLERIKGVHDVIPAFSGDGPADLLIAGAGTYERELRALAVGRPRVRFLGYVPSDRLRALYRGARALIASSVCYEVLPLVILEAFQHGIPIIARQLGPYPEIIEASRGGVLFASRAELEAAIRLFASDDARRDAMARAAQRAFLSMWSERVALGAYFELIRTVAARRSLHSVLEAFDARADLRA